MPDHVHLILTPQIDPVRQMVVSLSEIMKGVKGTSAHAINKQLDRKGTVWQIESFDHVLRSSESLDAKILYILENPVRQGLVQAWKEYRWLWQAPQELITTTHVGTDASSVRGALARGDMPG